MAPHHAGSAALSPSPHTGDREGLPVPARRVHLLQWIALGAGLACFTALLHNVGLATLVEGLRQIGWRLLVVIALEFAIDGFNTLGWRSTFEPADRHVGFAWLYLARLAGTAFNQVLPAAAVGGEPVKVMLLRGRVSAASGWASVITAKLSLGIAQSIFVLCGFAVAFGRLDVPPAVGRALVAALGLTVLGLALFLRWQRRGLFAAAADLAARLGVPKPTIERLRAATEAFDSRVRDLHLLRGSDFAESVAWHLVSFAIGVAQVAVLLAGLGLAVDVSTCLAIEAFSLLIQLALFFVPGSIGVQEAGKMILFTALGLPAAAGLVVAIAFRLTQLAGIAAGLSAFAALEWRRPGR